MRTILLSLLAAGALGGCGPKSSGTIGNQPPPSGRERVPCPTDQALDVVARKHFAAAAGDIGATCVAIWVDRPLWVLDGWHLATEDGAALITALVDPTTDTAVWTTGAGDFSLPPGAIDRMIGAGMTAVDLDGDGKDEIVNISGSAAQGYEVQSLSILTIGPTGLVTAGELPFAEDNSGADPDPADLQSCSTEWKLIEGPAGSKRLDLTVTVSAPGSDMCLPPGRHVMEWTGKELIEVTLPPS